MKRKNIGVLVGSMYQDYSRRICKAISEKGEECGYDVYFFTTFNSHGDNLLYGEGEQQIYSLPDFSMLDGVIIALDTLNVPEGATVLLERLRGLSCPVISLRVPIEGFYNIQVDESVSMERMIRHFVEVHGFSDICYLTGKMELEDAQLRYSCYRRVMEEYEIPVTDEMVYYGDYWKMSAPGAVDHFLAGRSGRYPEAIVCANDYMALAIVQELNVRGIKVPEDICVSGFDDLEEAQQCEPPLSTVAVNFEGIAYRAVELLDEIDQGQNPPKENYIPTQDKYRGSCGCKRHKVMNKWHSTTAELEIRRQNNLQTIFMNADLQGIVDETELLNIVNKYGQRNKAKRMWICLCDSSEELTEEEKNLGDTRTEYTKTMVLRAIIEPNYRLKMMEQKFDRSELIPEETRSEIENGSFYFVSLHYKNHNLGYVVVTYDNHECYNEFMQPWAMNYAIALENYYLHEKLDAMKDIRRLYREDTLTGIPNRRGFEEQARKVYFDVRYGRMVAVTSIDMDNLKTINDGFGHAAGDDALRRVAKALTVTVDGKENVAYGRTGGDEFVLICQVDSPEEGAELISKLREELKRINGESNQAYRAEVSCGQYVVKDVSKVALVRALEMSDERMYEDKRQRKTERK